MSDSQCHLVTTTSFHSIAIGNSSAAAFPSGLSLRGRDAVRSHSRSCASLAVGAEQSCVPHSALQSVLWLGMGMAELQHCLVGHRLWDDAVFALAASQEFDVQVLSSSIPLSRERVGVPLPLGVEAILIRNKAFICPALCFYTAPCNTTRPQYSC